MSEATCPRCGRNHSETDNVLCSACPAEPVSETTSSASSQTIQLAPILRQALAQVQPGEDLDEALLRALKADRPAEAAMLLPAISRLIADEVDRHGGSREEAVRRLAEGASGGEITMRTSDGRSPTFTTITEKRVIMLGNKEFESLNELPPDVRRAVEAGLSYGQKPRVRVGCSAALVVGLLGAFTRRG